MKYGVYTRHTAKPDQRDELVETLLKAAASLEGNPDCLHWIVNTTEDPNEVWVSVLWTTKEAHDASLEDEQMQKLIGEAKEFLSADVLPEQIFVAPVGGKGV